MVFLLFFKVLQTLNISQEFQDNVTIYDEL